MIKYRVIEENRSLYECEGCGKMLAYEEDVFKCEHCGKDVCIYCARPISVIPSKVIDLPKRKHTLSFSDGRVIKSVCRDCVPIIRKRRKEYFEKVRKVVDDFNSSIRKLNEELWK